jgi:hypothetical protein
MFKEAQADVTDGAADFVVGGEGIPRSQCTAPALLDEMVALLLSKIYSMMPNFDLDPSRVGKRFIFWYRGDDEFIEHVDGITGEKSMVVVYSLGGKGQLAYRIGKRQQDWAFEVIPANSLYLSLGNEHPHRASLLEKGLIRAVFVMFLLDQRSWPSRLAAPSSSSPSSPS